VPGACHTGRRSCFYRSAPPGQNGKVALEFRNAEKTIDPQAAYPDMDKKAARILRPDCILARQLPVYCYKFS
jgi:hypothetical protein